MIKVEEKPTSKVPGLTSLYVSFDYKQEVVDAIKSIACRDYNKKNQVWEVPLCYCAELLDKLTLYDDVELNILKDKKEEFKEYKISKYKSKPYKYQEEGIEYGLNKDNWLLLDDPGLGKTLSSAILACELKKIRKFKHCLIVCGINNLKTNWVKEIYKHTGLDSIILGQRINSKGRLIIGSVKDRLAQLKKPIKEYFIITNIETLREDSIVKELREGRNKIDMIIVDEIHSCKSHDSIQGKNLLKLKEISYKLGMTGTLLTNEPLDLYVPLKWIGVEKSNFTTFKTNYCSYTGPFNNILLGYKNLDLLKYQLSTCSLRRRVEDVLDLPEKNIIVEYVDMDDRQATFYDNIKSGIIDEVDKVHISVASLLSMIARLRQATAYPGILTTENIDSAKISRTVSLTEEIVNNGGKVVIFSTFKDTVYELQKRLSKFKPLIGTGDTKDSEMSANIDKFQSDKNQKIFIGTWQKCGTGITLNSASYMIFIDTPWTDASFRQACDRIYRIGTKRPVFIYNLVTKDTVDEKVLELITEKRAISEYIIDNQIDKNTVESLKKYILELK